MKTEEPDFKELAEREERLQQLRARRERFLEDLSRESYETLSGQKRESNVAAIYESYPDISTLATVELCRKALEGAEGLEERRRRYLLESEVLDFIGKETRTITDAVLTREAQATVEVDGDRLAFRNLAGLIRNEPDRDRRARLEAAQLRAIESFTPLLAEALALEHGIAVRLGYADYAAMVEALSGIALRALAQQLEGFLAATEDMYREVLSWNLKKRLGVELEDAKKHDLSFLFRAGEYDFYFQKASMVSTVHGCCEAMGLDPRAGGHVRYDLEDREAKSPRAFCATLRVPEEVVLVLKPVGGQQDWQSFLHELGLALQYGHISKTQPFEFRLLGDPSVPETYAFLFHYLTLSRGWLRRYLDFQKPKDYLLLAYLEKLYFLRRYAAKLVYELALHDGNGVEGKEEVYREHLHRATLVDYPKETYLFDVDRGFYSARYLRAWMLEALLEKHLVHYFDEDWFRNPRTGEFLRKRWAHGQRFTVEEVAKEMGYRELSAQPLIEAFAKQL